MTFSLSQKKEITSNVNFFGKGGEALYNKVSVGLVGNERLLPSLWIGIYLWMFVSFLFYMTYLFLNWWFTKNSHGFNFSLSPRMLVQKLHTRIDDMSTPNIIFHTLGSTWLSTHFEEIVLCFIPKYVSAFGEEICDDIKIILPHAFYWSKNIYK